MYKDRDDLRTEFKKETGKLTGDYPFTYINWIEDKIINSEKNNAKPPVSRRSELLSAFSWVSSIGEQFFDKSKTVDDMVDAYLKADNSY